MDPQIKPWSEGMESVNRAEFGRQRNETGLLDLAELRRQQEEAAAARAFLQQHPEFVLGGGGGPPQSLLGSLQTAPGGPPGGPMTQQAFGPGQPPGQPQVVPGGQDLSRFAGVSPQGGGPIPPEVSAQIMPTVTPPQSVLGSLGAPTAPQGPNPQQRLLELARSNPEAALKVQALMQQQQDAALKREETRLSTGTKVLEYVGRLAQGVTDQAGLVAMKQDLQRTGLHQYAAQLPEVYSKEAMAPFIAKALDVKESMTLQAQTMQAQAELKKAAMSGRVATTDEYLKAIGVTPGQETPQDMQRALELKNKHLAEIQAANVTPQLVQGEGGGYWAVNPRTLERRPVGGGEGGGTGPGGTGTQGEQLRAPMTEGQAKTAGYTSRMQSGQEQLTALEKSGDYTSWKAPVAQMPGGRLLLTDKQKEYEAAKGVFLTGLLRYDSAGQITSAEWKQYGELYFPQPDDPPSVVELKRQHREQAIKTHQEMLGRPVPGQKPATQAQPTSPAPPTSPPPAGGGAPAGAKVVTRAALHAEAQRRNVSPEQAEVMARQKGYEVR